MEADSFFERGCAFMASLRVQFLFDFGSPNAYLAYLLFPGIVQRTGAVFEYVPILLGGIFKAAGNRSHADSLQGVRNKPEFERWRLERFLQKHEITTFRQNPYFPVNTLALMRGAIAAQYEDMFDA